MSLRPFRFWKPSSLVVISLISSLVMLFSIVLQVNVGLYVDHGMIFNLQGSYLGGPIPSPCPHNLMIGGQGKPSDPDPLFLDLYVPFSVNLMVANGIVLMLACSPWRWLSISVLTLWCLPLAFYTAAVWFLVWWPVESIFLRWVGLPIDSATISGLFGLPACSYAMSLAAMLLPNSVLLYQQAFRTLPRMKA
jgi:hypothetical protein